jgi:hypothetical protein
VSAAAPLVDAFRTLGYSLYRFVPGLRALAPLVYDSNFNESDNLNMFAAKLDCAKRLAARGLLVLQSAQPPVSSLPLSTDVFKKLPYARAMADRWQGCEGAQASELEAAFALYYLSRDESRDLGERFVALQNSFERLYALCQESSGQEHRRPMRSLSLDRVAIELFCRQPLHIKTLVAEGKGFLVSNGGLYSVTRDDKEGLMSQQANGYTGMCFHNALLDLQHSGSWFHITDISPCVMSGFRRPSKKSGPGA